MSLLVVVDTNVIVDALFNDDKYAQRVINSILKEEITLAISHPIFREMMNVVMRHAIEAGLTLTQAKRPILKVAEMFSRAKHVNPTVKLEVADHSPDNKFFECAYEADITIIISSDGDVSELTIVKTCTNRVINVYSPWQFICKFKIKG